MQAYVPTQGRQRLYSHRMLTTHPRLTTDSFTLYIKATVLLGKVKAFNGRFRYRYTDGDGKVTFDSFPPLSPDGGSAGSAQAGYAPVKDATKIRPQKTDEFQALDGLIQSFVAHIPNEYKDAVGSTTGVKLDPTLYLAHMLPHV